MDIRILCYVYLSIHKQSSQTQAHTQTHTHSNMNTHQYFLTLYVQTSRDKKMNKISNVIHSPYSSHNYHNDYTPT
ncbi:hypothetical protein EON63_13895 [archaeon]|nr:MAG: hypothetical protein EON63_13895 [archaeon]